MIDPSALRLDTMTVAASPAQATTVPVTLPVSVVESVATTAAPLDLDRYVDAHWVKVYLQQHLPGFEQGRLRVDAVTVEAVRRNTSQHRKPSPMSMCYRLRVIDVEQARGGELVLSATVYRSGLSAEAFEVHRHRTLEPPTFGQALVHLPEVHLLLWALPNDPALPQLPALLDPERVVLEQPLARLGADPRRLEVALLRYVPQRRASLRYTLAPEPGGIARTLHAKTFFDTRAPAIHERFEWFWQLSQRDASAPRVAAPLGHDAHTIWQEGLVGTPLTAHLEGDTASIMRATAGALAHLHDAPLGPSPTATPHTSEHWMHEVRLRLKKLARVDESLGERVQTVVDALEATAAHQQARPLSLIHGDFHHDQFWVDDDGRLIMFDFDEFNRGDPMEDLAEFLTKLEPLDIAGHRRAALVEHYAAITSRYDARSLQWHLTIQSLLQATRAFVYQQPGWKVALSQRLDRTLSHAALLG